MSYWHSVDLADKTVVAYAGSETVQLLTLMLDEPRKRTVLYGDI